MIKLLKTFFGIENAKPNFYTSMMNAMDESNRRLQKLEDENYLKRLDLESMRLVGDWLQKGRPVFYIPLPKLHNISLTMYSTDSKYYNFAAGQYITDKFNEMKKEYE